MSLLTLERTSPSPQDSENEDLLSTSSYEGFVARDHYALCLSPRPFTSLGPGRSCDSLRIFSHLKKLVKLLRPQDTLRMAVELENCCSRKVTKYLVIVTTNGYVDTEETVVLGTEQENSTVRICLVLPLWRDTEIKLDGDGGFSVHTGDRHQVFKPSSVQSMWAALQMMYKATTDAQHNNYYVGGLSHTWMTFYALMLTEDGSILNEWNQMEDVESFRPNYGSDGSKTDERVGLEETLTAELRNVMIHQDLEEVTSRQLRLLLEEKMEMDLKEYRGFLDQQMLRILGQMESPSQIFDYLYLGSEWNASNLKELKDKGVKYILNISREIDNFYPEEFKYLNIRLYDLPNSELMKHWDKTYTFIKEAKTSGKAVLVHCKMGISRSAATVTAFVMKEYKMSLSEALKHVKLKRNIVNPNEGFLNQLQAYEGILRARHNELWGKMAPSRPQPLNLYRVCSKSEPNIPDMLSREVDEEEPELTFLEEGGDQENFVSGQEAKKNPRFLQIRNLSHFNPNIDKTANIRNFLASLPNIAVEDDPGLGDNVCTSESGSGYSSPISSPTDDDHLSSCYKLAREIRREHKSAVLQREEEGGGKEGGRKEAVDGGLDDTKEQKTKSKELPPNGNSAASATAATKEQSSLGEASSSGGGVVPESSGASVLEERCQPIAAIPIFHGIPKPLKSTSLPLNLMSHYDQSGTEDYPIGDSPANPDTVSESMFAEHGSTNVSDLRSESMLSLSEQSRPGQLDTSGPIELPQIHSVPERIKEIEEMNSLKSSSKSPSIPPGETSVPPGETSVPPGETSVPPGETSVPPGETSVPPDMPTGETSMAPDETSVADVPPNEVSAETSEPPAETSVPPPAETPAETSVPPTETSAESVPPTETSAESVPPTETSAESVPPTETSAESVPPTETSAESVPPTETSAESAPPTETSAESVPPTETSAETSVPPDDASGKVSVPPCEGDNEEFGTVRTASNHSAVSSGGEEEEEEELNLLSDNSSSHSIPITTTRHSSISPYPLTPSSSSHTGQQEHMRRASCSHLPQLSSPSPLPSGDVVQLEAGAVKARIQNIEKNRDDTHSDDLSARKQGKVGGPEKTTSDLDISDIKQLISAQRRPSSEIIQEHRSPANPLHQRRETTPPAFLSAWSKLVDGIPTMPPVQDLKKKFEDSDTCTSSSSHKPFPPAPPPQKGQASHLRRSRSLRDMESPGKTRYRFKKRKLYSTDSHRAESPSSQD